MTYFLRSTVNRRSTVNAVKQGLHTCGAADTTPASTRQKCWSEAACRQRAQVIVRAHHADTMQLPRSYHAATMQLPTPPAAGQGSRSTAKVKVQGSRSTAKVKVNGQGQGSRSRARSTVKVNGQGQRLRSRFKVKGQGQGQRSRSTVKGQRSTHLRQALRARLASDLEHVHASSRQTGRHDANRCELVRPHAALDRQQQRLLCVS
jgi:hypothetical protein